MKDKIILLVDADADCAGLVLEAGARTGHGVRLSRDSREAFGFLSRDFEQIDCVVIDIDPGNHGIALLEAISVLPQRPPIILLTGLEESHLAPVAARHGAAGCLGKPVSIERLKAVLVRSTRIEWSRRTSCDPWGHPRPCGQEVENEACA